MGETLLRRSVKNTEPVCASIERLSDREAQAFENFGHGLTTDLIAAKMHVSHKTIETYLLESKKNLV